MTLCWSVLLCGLVAVAALKPNLANAADSGQPKALQLAQQQDCFSCHAIDHDVVGPAWLKIAKTYNGQPQAVIILTFKVIKGGQGHWGSVAMPAHPKLSQADAREIVEWILSLKGDVKEGPRLTFTYKDSEGKPVTVDFKAFNDGRRQVTNDIFLGYE